MDIENFNIGELQCYRDWDCEGAICMRNPKTIERYQQLRDEQFDFEKHGMFFAFSQEQFDNQYDALVKKGYLSKDVKLSRGFAGSVGPKEGFEAFNRFADDQDARIAKECDPQEVYIYEWNNHECMFGNEESAYAIVEDIFGKERASKIKRF